MTDKDALREHLRALDEAEMSVLNAMEPFRLARDAIVGARDLLLDQAGLETAGSCEHCGTTIFAGEPCHRAIDVILCEDHAPTWGDVKAQTEWPDAADHYEDGEDGLAACVAAVEAHVQGGGSLTDKCLHTA